MALKKTTVMVDEEDLALVKEAAAREGRPESEYFREAFHLVALRTQRWSEDWDIPRFDFGYPVTPDEISEAVSDAVWRCPCCQRRFCAEHVVSRTATPRCGSI